MSLRCGRPNRPGVVVLGQDGPCVSSPCVRCSVCPVLLAERCQIAMRREPGLERGSMPVRLL
eukprot:6688306-Prymnesium_polylepis.1